MTPQSAPLEITVDNFLRLRNLSGSLKDYLRDQLKFLNPKWVENNRMGRWNRGVPRELRFFRKLPQGGLRIPRGYLRELLLHCREHEIPYQLVDRRRTLPVVDVRFRGRLKPFQTTAVDAMAARDFGTLSAPTGSGKTVMALALVARRRQPTLIVVHTKDLALQWQARAETFLGLDPQQIGMIGGGRSRHSEIFSVALVQSLYARAREIAPKTGFIIVDECHRCPSRTFTEAVNCFDARYMLGLSATPFRRDRLSRLIFWHLGNIHHEIDQQRLQRQGEVLSAELTIRVTDFEPYFDPVQDYSRMLAELTADDDRNRLIAADVARESAQAPGVCLVLSDRKKHCENLRALLKFRHGVDAALLTGDLSTSQRMAVLEAILGGRARVVVATGQLIGEGFDCGPLTTLFLATPIRFSGRVVQYIGRVLRPAPGKTQARVYDYVDLKVGPLKAAFHSRLRVYRENGITGIDPPPELDAR
ncbi:MAG: DEAD/DEAH box helicase [Desulfobacterales bacterium]